MKTKSIQKVLASLLLSSSIMNLHSTVFANDYIEENIINATIQKCDISAHDNIDSELIEKIDIFFDKIKKKDNNFQKKVYLRLNTHIDEKIQSQSEADDYEIIKILSFIKCSSSNNLTFLNLTDIQKKYYKFYKEITHTSLEVNNIQEYHSTGFIYWDTDLITQLIFNQDSTDIFTQELLYTLDKKISEHVHWNFYANTVVNIEKDFHIIMWVNSLFIYNQWEFITYNDLELFNFALNDPDPCKIEKMVWDYSFKVICNDQTPHKEKLEHLFWKNWEFIKTIQYEFTKEYIQRINEQWIWWTVEYKPVSD